MFTIEYIFHPIKEQWMNAACGDNGTVPFFNDTEDAWELYWKECDYVAGYLPSRYPVPAIRKEPWCLFCGSTEDRCKLHPHPCLELEFCNLWN